MYNRTTPVGNPNNISASAVNPPSPTVAIPIPVSPLPTSSKLSLSRQPTLEINQISGLVASLPQSKNNSRHNSMTLRSSRHQRSLTNNHRQSSTHQSSPVRQSTNQSTALKLKKSTSNANDISTLSEQLAVAGSSQSTTSRRVNQKRKALDPPSNGVAKTLKKGRRATKTSTTTKRINLTRSRRQSTVGGGMFIIQSHSLLEKISTKK